MNTASEAGLHLQLTRVFGPVDCSLLQFIEHGNYYRIIYYRIIFYGILGYIFG